MLTRSNARRYTVAALLASASLPVAALAQGDSERARLEQQLQEAAQRQGIQPATAQPVQLQPTNTVPAQLPEALKFDSMSHDFGTIADTAPVSHTFNFTNTTDRTIKITFAASCGCTTAPLTKDTYAPGESGSVTATFNPQGRSGQQPKTLTMTVIDPQGVYAQQYVTITSNVKPLVQIDPPKMYLSEVDHREGHTAKLTITGRKEGFRITGVQPSSEFVTAQLGEPVETEENGEKLVRYEVTVSVGKGAPLGSMNTQIAFETNDTALRVPTYFLGAEIIGDARANPAQALIRANTTNQPFTTQVRLDSRSGSTFNISSIDIEGRPDMKLAADVEKGDGGKWYLLTLSGVTPDQPGMVTGAIVVATDTEGGEVIRIPFNGAVRRAAPQAGMSPAAAQPVTLTPVPAPAGVPTAAKPTTPAAKPH